MFRRSIHRHLAFSTSSLIPPPLPLTTTPTPPPQQHRQQQKQRRHHSRPKPKPKPPTGGAVNRPVAYLPPHKLSLTPEERAAPPPTPVQRGREEVAALCNVLPEGSEDRAECEDALVYYERLAAGDGEACSLAAAEAASGGGAAATSSPWTSSASSRFADPACADEKERFESFVRELLYAGSVSAFVKALGRRKRAEEERREREEEGSGTPSSPPSTSAADIDAETERRRQGLVALFRAYDRDGNGRLDAAEFREAAAAAGDPLTGSEVAKIFTALDIHGAGVSLDDFLAAVEVKKKRRERESFSSLIFFVSFLRSPPLLSLSRTNKNKPSPQAEDFMKPASPLAAWLRAHAGGGSVGELPGVDQLL